MVVSLRKFQSSWLPTLGGVFRTLLIVRLISAFCMHISDCDETFNYWEPAHYLMYGSGFQTWEYSPTYAIRSYGYLLLHLLPLLVTNTTNKMVVFSMLRIMLAIVCVFCEFYFYRAVLQKYGADVARWTLLFLVGSCGMYIAAPAFLPSSFSMYCCMIIVGAWLQKNYELAIFATAVSALVGWPFSAALGLPVAFDIIFSQKRPLLFIFWSLFSFIIIAAPLAAVDSLYYGKFVLAPLNILQYNVFGKSGPDLYGVEPWSFYFINGFLNLNVVFILAVLAFPLIESEVFTDALVVSIGRGYSWLQIVYSTLLAYSGRRLGSFPSKESRKAVQPMLIWMLIFFTRPHKEERFLFPIYPLFCLSAAISVRLLPDVMPVVWGLLKLPKSLRKLSRALLSWLPLITCVLHVVLSSSRAYALYRGYHAPLDVYKTLHMDEADRAVRQLKEVNLCVGKEWHRFPSSFFLPDEKWKLRFIRSDFHGQLPQPYSPHRNATWVIPNHMNDMNQEEPSRYFDVQRCNFLVDLDLPVATAMEPRYAQDKETWEIIARYPFLDAARSHQLYRAFYIPWLSPSHTRYADYVLLVNKKIKLSQSGKETSRPSFSAAT